MDRVAQSVLGAGVTAVLHPFTYAKVLIQVGYEPMEPTIGRTMFGRQELMYPNTFKYIGYIKKTDGFFGLYRGLGARLVSGIICHYVSNTVHTSLTNRPLGPEADVAAEGEEEEIRPRCPAPNSSSDIVLKVLKDSTYETISRSAGIVVSHPFHVIFVRCCAQFVGREVSYNSVFSSVSEIYNNEGIFGFFSGLVPRLVGEVITIWLANILAQVIDSFIASTQTPDSFKSYTSMISQLMANQVTYPFMVVSTVMTVNDCGLAAGRLPIQPVYSSWLDCWQKLSAEGEIKRGSGMFNRIAKRPIVTGPVMTSSKF